MAASRTLWSAQRDLRGDGGRTRHLSRPARPLWEAWPGFATAAGGGVALRIEGTGQGLIVTPVAGSDVLFPCTALATLTGVVEPGEPVLECTVTLT